MDVDAENATAGFVDAHGLPIYFGAGEDQDHLLESLQAAISNAAFGEEAPPGVDSLEDDNFQDPFAVDGGFFLT